MDVYFFLRYQFKLLIFELISLTLSSCMLNDCICPSIQTFSTSLALGSVNLKLPLALFLLYRIYSGPLKIGSIVFISVKSNNSCFTAWR